MNEVRRAEIQKRLRELEDEYQRTFLATTPLPPDETPEWSAETRQAYVAWRAEKLALEEELQNLD